MSDHKSTADMIEDILDSGWTLQVQRMEDRFLVELFAPKSVGTAAARQAGSVEAAIADLHDYWTEERSE